MNIIPREKAAGETLRPHLRGGEIQKEGERGFVRDPRFQSWEGFPSEVHGKVKAHKILKYNSLSF